MSQIPSQAEICEKFGSLFSPLREDEKVGIALATLSQLPLNALRHSSEHDTSGWYIWGGELSDSPDFFQPLHVHHLVAHAPVIVPYLALAPGWRVLLAPGHEDVWYDPALLAV
jgi:hypothetical protein